MSDLFGTPDIAAEVQAEKAYGPIYGAQYQDAAKSAKANELGRRLGIPADVVDADIPNMMAQDRVNRAIAHARANAAYAQMMSNPRLAAAGIDDHHLPAVAAAAANHQHYVDFGENIRKHGWLVGSLANVGYGAEVLGGRLLSGVSQIAAETGGIVHAAEENIPGVQSLLSDPNTALASPLLYSLGQVGRARNTFRSAADTTRVTTSNRTFNDIAGGVESVPSNALGLLATAYGGPAGGAAAFGAMSFGDSYEEGRDAGLTPHQAAMYGAGDAAIMAATTFLPEKYLGGVLAGKGGGLGAILSGLGGMGIATGLQGLNRWYWIDRHHGVTFDQFLGTLPDEERTALTGTMVALGLSVGGAHLAAKVVGHTADTQAAANLDKVMEAAKESPTRRNNPSDFHDALNQVIGDNGDLYVPAEKVLDLFNQEGSSRTLREDPFWGRYAPQVEEAATLGGDVVVPLADAATHLAGTTDWAALRDHVRTRPGGASMEEVRQAQSPEELEALASEVANRIDEALPQMKAQGLTRAFADALGYKGEQADAISQLLGAGLHRAYALEVAKRQAAGEPVPPMEEFAAEWLPIAEKTTQAAYDAERRGGIAPPPEASESFDPMRVFADAVGYIKKGGSPSIKSLAKRYGISEAQALKLSGALAGLRNLPLKMTKSGLRRASSPNSGMDVISFIRAMGGIKDDAGHDLSKGRGYSKRPGLINNRTGHSIDDIGEALHEAGYTGREQPTEAETLDLIERAFNEKTFTPDRQVDVREEEQRSYEDSLRSEIQDAAKEHGFDLNAEDEDFALELMSHGYYPDEAVKGAHELRAYSDAADSLDEAASQGVKGDYAAKASEELRAAIADRVRRALTGPPGEYVPGFDSEVDRILAARRPSAASDFDLFQTLNQLFEEPDQPKRTMTQAQRAELEARVKQSMARRGGQESVKDQAGGLFSSERDQDTLFQSANPDQTPPDSEKEPIPYRSVPPIPPAMLRKIMRGGAAIDEKTGEILHDTQRRGNITIDRDAEGMMVHSVIRAFEAADFSTAIHETGHFFLEDLKRRALRPDATEQEKADWRAVKDWAGELGHGVGEDNLIPEPAHETFARGFERYIYEGRAPSAGLKAVFAKMRDFMVALYRSVRSFNAPITPQIREVMDRLLASDDEINARRQELHLGEQTLSELMSKDEQARYAELGTQAREAARDALYDRVLSTIRAERTREVSRRKGEIRQDVTDEIDKQPVFRALKLLRSGVEQEDGSTQRATLPREWLVDNYGEGILDKLPKGVPPIYDDAHGVDPESIALRSGFDSADQMIQSLLDHEEGRQQLKANGDTRAPRRAMIEGMTEDRLRSEMGDPFANLEEEADSALANDRQADVLSMELRALSRKTGKSPVPWKLANDWAKAHIRQSTSKDAISGAAIQMYSRAAAKAADAVEEALTRTDYEAAFRAKQQQVLNLALMKQAKDAKDEVLAGVKRLRKVARAKTIPSVDQDYLDQAHQLLESVDMKNRPAKAVDKRLAFEAWHAKQVEMDIDPVVPPEYRATLGQTHWTRLSINDLLDLDKAVKQIVKLGRLKQELKDGARKRAFNEGVSEMQDRGGQVPPRSRRGGTTDPRKSPIGRAASRIRSIDAAMLKTEQVCIWLDNHDPNGPWQRLIYRPFADAQGRYSDLARSYGKEINDLIKAYPKKALRGLTRRVDTPELVIRNSAHLSNGEAFRGTKDQVLAMALNWGNLGNRQRLLDGFGWNENAVASVFDRTLTKDDWDLVQGVWDTVDKLWPDVARLEREVNGVEPEKVEAAEVPTPHGTYRGGYFPIVYDPMQTTGSHQAAEDKGAPSGGWWTLSTRSSATKERAEQVKGRPILLSLSTITHHMHEVIHDITHRQAVNQVKRLLADDRVAGIVNTRMGPEYTKAMRSWLENVAKPNHAYSRASPAVLWMARYLNKAITTVGLGFRVSVSAKQLLGIPFSGKELGSDHLAKGMAIVMAHPVKAYSEMTERSAEMRARSDHLDASIEDMRHDLSTGKLRQIGPRGITKYAFQGIVYMDVVSRTVVWTSAYNKALSEGMTETDAIAYGDRAVRQSHGIGFQKDRAAIQYDHPIARALWPFFSYLNALYNAQRDVGHRVARAETARDYAEASRRAWWVFAVPALLSAALFDDGPEDKDGNGVSVGEWAEYLANQVILGNLASLPVVGNFAQSLGHGYSYRAISYQQIGDSIGKAVKEDQKIGKGDAEVTGSSIKHTMESAGEIFAKPLGQIGSTAGGLYDYETGRADPQTAGDWYNLLTRGYIPKQPTAAERLAGRTS